jgi:outer membrane translocation and assembly module TamA
VTPRLGGIGRFVARAQVAALLRETANRFYTLGGLTGLRGYAIGQFTGLRQVVGNLEFRTVGTRVWFTRVGAVAFWDLGHAADRFADLGLRHDVGVGARMLIPQFSTLVFRFDWAIPLVGATAGFPGRVSAGFEQAF